MNKNEITQLYRAGKYAAALEAIVERPPSTWRDTAELRCLRALGRSKEALALANSLYRDEITQNDHRLSDAELSNQLRVLAKTFERFDQPAKASQILAELVKINPSSTSLRLDFGSALLRQGQHDQAELILNSVVSARPTDEVATLKLGELFCETTRINDGINAFYRALSVNTQNLAVNSLLCYWEGFRSGNTDQSCTQIANLYASHLKQASEQVNNMGSSGSVEKTKTLSETPQTSTRTRIAFVINHLAKTREQASLLPLIEPINRDEFQVIIYNDHPINGQPDRVLKQVSDLVKNVHGITNDDFRQQILDDEIDIIVDTVGHDKSNRIEVFATRCAPLQISWLTHQTTSGNGIFDYTITDSLLHPVKLNKLIGEKLLYLDSGSHCFRPPQNAPEVIQRSDDSIVILGSFVDIARISSITLDCWADAMVQLSDAVLVIKQPRHIARSTQSTILTAFADRGVASNRIILDEYEDTIEARLDQYTDIDIALDSSPHNGHLATLEALWMGVPVVSLLGNSTPGRISTSLYNQIEIEGFVADSVSEFANIVVRLAEHPDQRSELRSTLRETMRNSNLVSEGVIAAEFESAVKHAWNSLTVLASQSAAEANI